MKALETLHLNDAAGKKNKFDLSRSHLTTLEIGEILPILHEDLVPGDSFNIGESVFARLAPLSVPTYGSFYFKTASMFVPYYQLFEGAEAFFAGKTVSRGKTINMPKIRKGTILSLLILPGMSINPASVTSTADYDFCFTTNSNVVEYRKLTRKGKYVYKVLRSLGYQIPNCVSATSNIAAAPTYSDILNALPILAFFKAYNDYMSMSQRFDTSVLTSTLESIRLGETVSGSYVNGEILAGLLKTMFDTIYLQYENDYFTSCWASPNNPLGASDAGDIESLTFNDMSSMDGSVARTLNGNYASLSTSFGSVVSARALDFLGAFDRWVRRNNYSGTKDVEKIYSRFGIKPEDYKAQYAHLINTNSSSIQVGDVTSLSDTSTNGGAVLGDYAGKGIINDSTSYKYTADDFGMLITLSWITVKPVYADGYDRSVLKTQPLDFFNPEFDALGGNAIPQGEVFVDRKNQSHIASTENTVFGFNERYSEYKVGNKNQITGDFIIYEDMDAWHFNREDLKALAFSNDLVAQRLAFNSVNNTNSVTQYNRIFNSETDDVEGMADHFYITANFNVDAYRPMKNLNEVPNLGVGDTVVPRNGNTLN